MGLFSSGIEAAKTAGRDMAVNLVTVLVAGGMALIGLGFLTGAAYIALAGHFGSLMACVLMGAAFLAMAALAVAIRFAAATPDSKPLAAASPPPPVDPMAQMTFEIGYGIGRVLFSRRRD